MRREGIRTSRKGAMAIFTACTGRREGGVNGNRALLRIKSSQRGLATDLNVPELCDFQEARLPLSEHEQAFLSHSYFTNAAGGLDAGRQLVDALIVVETIYDLRGQADVLGPSFCLLPEGIEQPEHSRIHLISLGWDEAREIRSKATLRDKYTPEKTNIPE